MTSQLPTESLVGCVVEGVYQIARLLGEGGMGTVYEAVHLRLNMRVTVKVMARHLAANDEALARFRREAEVTSAIGHPHIVQVFDSGVTTSGEPYLVMEYLEGEDFESRIRRVQRLSPMATLHIVRQVASALTAAHHKGIVHRDLKPANIYVLDVAGEPDFVKVLDFGVSKVLAATTNLTRPSRVLGTPRYMAPEQAQGLVDQIDHRTDQWALACITWEALSGQTPFVADEELSLLYQVVYGVPAPLVRKVNGLRPEVEQVLRRALSKDQEDRFADVQDFVLALESAISGKAPNARMVTQLRGVASGASGRRGKTMDRAFDVAQRVRAAVVRRRPTTTARDIPMQAIAPKPPHSTQRISVASLSSLAGGAIVVVGSLWWLSRTPAHEPSSSTRLQAEPEPAPALSAPTLQRETLPAAVDVEPTLLAPGPRPLALPIMKPSEPSDTSAIIEKTKVVSRPRSSGTLRTSLARPASPSRKSTGDKTLIPAGAQVGSDRKLIEKL